MMKNRIYPVLLLFLVCIVWEAIARSGLLYGPYFPPITGIFLTLGRLLVSVDYLYHVLSTISKLLLGIIIASVLGTGLGMIFGSNPKLLGVFRPLIEFMRPIPAVALIPIAILFFGIGMLMKSVVIVYASIWPILINTIDGVRRVDEVLIQTGKLYGLTKWESLCQIVFPASKPYIISGIKISSAICLILVITTEMVGGSNGLGFFILYAERSFQIEEMYAGIMTIALIGYIVSIIFRSIENNHLSWHKQHQSG